MSDQQFLWWIHERLRIVHGEFELVDYMHKLRAIIDTMDPNKCTPATMPPSTNELRNRFGDEAEG